MLDKVIGIDEVGRGCWAGPLVVGAVLLTKPIDGLTDSKLLSKQARLHYAEHIKSQATFYGLGWCWPDEIDQFGLTQATTLAIQRALKNAPPGYDILIDGSYNYLRDNPRARTQVKADLHIPSVSAASVLAKVARDEYMAEQSKVFPDYGFDKHVGYGTAYHKKALLDFGITPIHRKSYKPIQLLQSLQ